MDVPFRFIPCLAAGLAYYLALKIAGGAERLPVLKQQYDDAWELAATEDREKAAIRFVPRQMFIGGGTKWAIGLHLVRTVSPCAIGVASSTN
jgi:hypothetical protein